MRKLTIVALWLCAQNAFSQQPSQEATQGVINALVKQREIASNDFANCMGDVSALKALLERAEKELASLKPQPEKKP